MILDKNAKINLSEICFSGLILEKKRKKEHFLHLFFMENEKIQHFICYLKIKKLYLHLIKLL